MQDALLKLETSDITKPDGTDRIIARLNKIYKKDKLTQKYNAQEVSDAYMHKSTSIIRYFLT